MFFKILLSRILAIFDNFATFFNSLTYKVIFHVLTVRKSPLAFENKLLQKFVWSWIDFQISNITSFINFS